MLYFYYSNPLKNPLLYYTINFTIKKKKQTKNREEKDKNETKKSCLQEYFSSFLNQHPVTQPFAHFYKCSKVNIKQSLVYLLLSFITQYDQTVLLLPKQQHFQTYYAYLAEDVICFVSFLDQKMFDKVIFKVSLHCSVVILRFWESSTVIVAAVMIFDKGALNVINKPFPF